VYALALIGRCGVQQELVPPVYTHRTGCISLHPGLAIFALHYSSGIAVATRREENCISSTRTLVIAEISS